MQQWPKGKAAVFERRALAAFTQSPGREGRERDRAYLILPKKKEKKRGCSKARCRYRGLDLKGTKREKQQPRGEEKGKRGGKLKVKNGGRTSSL